MNLQQALLATEEKMLSAVASDVPVLQEASRHIISAGGKRLRPRMMYLAYLANGGQHLEEAVPVAAALELVHTATLVHDDINDHGTLRRGRVTINEQWGRTFALLTGDFLFAKVYELMAPYGDLNVTFSKTAVTLVEGETLQAYAAKHDQLDRETYQQIVAKKTASLFRASTLLGSQLAQAEPKVANAFGEYGFYVGLAFQIIDDILDIVGDPRLTGKTTGLDLSQGKGVASLYSSNGGNGHGTNGTTAVAEEVEADPILALKKRMVEKGAVEEGYEMAQVLSAQALESLQAVPQNDHTDQLRDVVDAVVNRDH
jgi:geranylgeranyl pyrophosphate synthase